MHIETAPTLAQWKVWWDVMQAEQLQQSFNDDFPDTLRAFLDESGMHPRMILDGETIIAVPWMHDVTWDDVGRPIVAWMAGYVMPAYRGRYTRQCCALFLEGWRFRGLQHLCASAHSENKASHLVLQRYVGLEYVGTIPRLASFGGTLCDISYFASPGSAEVATAQMQQRLAQVRL